jgi:probable phosphoglycerate mutase
LTGAAPIAARDFYFSRRGQTGWNLQCRAQRTTDIALNEAGLGESKDAANRLKGAGLIKRIVSSPLRRAMETAAIVGDALKLPVRTDRRV